MVIAITLHAADAIGTELENVEAIDLGDWICKNVHLGLSIPI